MRPATILALLLLVVHPAALMAQDCASEALDQQSMNACAWQDWQQADKALNDAYRLAREAARMADADLAPGEVPAADMLRDAQRAWISFRDKACAAEATQMRGGSAEALLLYGCMARLTRQRTDDLRAFAETY